MAKYDPLAKRIGRLKPLDFVKYVSPKDLIEKLIGEKLMAELLESKTLQAIENKGIEKGREKQIKEDIIELLGIRFGKVTKKVKERISNVTSEKELHTLFQKSAKVESLKELGEFLESMPKK